MNVKQYSQRARNHIKDMESKYEEQINNSIDKSIVYRNYINNFKAQFNPNKHIEVVNLTTSDAVFSYSDENTATLNFASYKYPGGGFVVGAMAQEEAICHDSTLFNVLSDYKFEKEYQQNRNTNNNYGLYSNFGIYSPEIIFDDGETQNITNIITCAAPNLRTFYTLNEFNEENINRVKYTLIARINFILDIAEKHGNKNLILGAFGCGVFKNDPKLVAEIFKNQLEKSYNFDKVIFAIPSSNKNDNYKIFKEVFNV